MHEGAFAACSGPKKPKKPHCLEEYIKAKGAGHWQPLLQLKEELIIEIRKFGWSNFNKQCCHVVDWREIDKKYADTTGEDVTEDAAAAEEGNDE